MQMLFSDRLLAPIPANREAFKAGVSKAYPAFSLKRSQTVPGNFIVSSTR